MDVVNIKDIKKLEEILENIKAIYSKFYEKLPKDLRESLKNKD